MAAKLMLRVTLLALLFPQIVLGDPVQIVSLLEDHKLSARLLYHSLASLAAEQFLTVEFDNRSGAPIDVDQAFLQLDANRFDAVTGKAISTGGVAGGVLFRGFLKPGITQLSGYVCDAAKMGLGLPPSGGLSVEMIVHLDMRLTDRHDFTTPPQGISFHVDWKYPSPSEIEHARVRLRGLLAKPEHTFEHSAQLGALIVIPEVSSTLTADEVLDALQSRTDSVDGRNLVVWLIAAHFLNDPKVVAYYLSRLSAGDRAALFDVGSNLQLWNRTWIEPLVANFEKTGDSDTLRVLVLHRQDWSARDTESLSAALLKFRPILRQETSALTANQLYKWCQAAAEAGTVRDKDLIPLLSPALDNKRDIPYPLTQMGPPPQKRVCDWAVTAILTILDGNPQSGFNHAGADIWGKNPASHTQAFDRVIALTKDRLK